MDGIVFISYSRQDDAYREELFPSLQAVADVRDRIWFDQQGIEVGDEFHPKIQQALAGAKVALLLLSNHFLNSSYIRQHELPAILRRWQDGSLQLGILYVTSIADPALRIDLQALGIDLPAGSPCERFELTSIHSFNTRKTPLDRILILGERHRIYADVAEWVAAQFPAAHQPSSQPFPETYACRPQLAIFLAAGRDPRHFLPTQPNAICQQLDCPHPEQLSRGATGDSSDQLDGEVLFQVLFGRDQTKAGELLAAAFGRRGSADPTFAPLRVRLIAHDRRLHELPWNAISHRGRLLRNDGWTVEWHDPKTDSGFPALPDHVCYFPGRVVIAAATGDRWTAHSDDLRRFFQRRWPENPAPALARSAGDLREALAVGSTRLLYYYGGASAAGLVFADGDAAACLAWQDLAAWLRDCRSVDLVFLNLLGEAAAPALAGGAVLVAAVRGAVLVQCNPSACANEAVRSGVDWLAAVLETRLDPVVALYRRSLGRIAAWTRYASWQTIAPARLHHPDLVKLLLDRHDQRNALAGARGEFYTYPARTVHHVVALGNPGCLTREFPAMIHQHLLREPRDPQEAYFHHGIDLAACPGDLRSVDDAVRRCLRLQPQQPLLDRLLERDAIAGTTFAFVVLGWQVHPTADDSAQFVAAAEPLLRAVADWCCQRLGNELAELDRAGTRVRVLSIVALESEHAGELTATLEDLIEEYGNEQRFHFAELARLGAVGRRDLRNYFRNPAICTCDERYREDFPELLLAGRKEMPFEDAVATIRRGDPDNWATLYQELRESRSCTSSGSEQARKLNE